MIALPTIQGIIRRRILANYRADPDVVARLLPAKFKPKVHRDRAVIGICLIALDQIRPLHTPSFIGVSSENAAHRIAVTWADDDGTIKEGVYIPRFDTNSSLNHFAGGRIFPGEHNLADFDVADDGTEIRFQMESRDGKVWVRLNARSADRLPVDSIFESVAAASKYFEGGSLGYSVTHDPQRLDGIVLDTKEWRVEPLAVSEIGSSFYENRELFPDGSVEFDHALIMRNISHEWHGYRPLILENE